jgi:hypothetical protein
LYDDVLLRNNSHDLLELAFNLTDATLKGTGDHLEKMEEVVSRYQLRLNQPNLIRDAFINCTLTEECSDLLNYSQT